MSIEFTTEVSVQIECATCGEELEATMGGKYSYSNDAMKIKPCQCCMESAAQTAKEEAERAA
jgi:hypothetical protein